MNFKTLIAAMVVALAPMTASAALVEMCADPGVVVVGPQDITTGDIYNCDFNTTAANGSVQLDFFAPTVPASAMAANINLSLFGSLTSATLAWYEGDGTLISSVAASLNGAATMLPTAFSGPAPDAQYVLFSWTGFSGPAPLDIQVQVAPVPVPAGILLMGTALAGFGVMRRRKKAA